MSASAAPKQGGVEAIRALVADAQPMVAVTLSDYPEPGDSFLGIRPGQWVPDSLGLPPQCPVTPLGFDGAINWCLDPTGQLVGFTEPYGRAGVLTLFRGCDRFLKWAWPKFTARQDPEGNPTVDGWKNEDVAAVIVGACTLKGPWTPTDKMRGRGVWLGGSGQYVLHLGPELIVDGRRAPPGEIDGHVYPTRPRIPSPWPTPVPDDKNPARLLRTTLRTWHWSRPDIDPQLLIGWIGAGFLSSALPWRPMVYLTGDKGTGKSTLQELIKGLFGEWLISTTNTTAAGIYQHVGQDGLPVAIDEFEAGEDNEHAKRVLVLARQASSGGGGLRGGDRGKGTEFTIRSSFIFSSINAPPLHPQDLSRMGLLQLKRLPSDAEKPNLSPQTLNVLGRCILRRMLDGWKRYERTYDAFRGELAKSGMDSRGQDTFGTMLACADLLEFDSFDEAHLRVPIDGDLVPWHEVLRPSRMIEFEDQQENWFACLAHLLSVPIDAWRNGGRVTVGQQLEAWYAGHDDFNNDITRIKSLLSQAGLGFRREAGRKDWLVVPNQNPLTRRLFNESKWGGDIGASVWAGALRQAPEDICIPGQTTVNGVKSKCTLVSLDRLYGDGGIMSDRLSVPPPSPDPIMAET